AQLYNERSFTGFRRRSGAALKSHITNALRFAIVRGRAETRDSRLTDWSSFVHMDVSKRIRIRWGTFSPAMFFASSGPAFLKIDSARKGKEKTIMNPRMSEIAKTLGVVSCCAL